MIESRKRLQRAFNEYAQRHPNETGIVAFVELLTDPSPVFTREHQAAHFTGSAWLVSADGRRVLLTHHRKLGRWLQLGGHADGEEDLPTAALREAEEESGLTDLVIDERMFDLDRHEIPARGSEPAHWHYDVRYVVRATGSEMFAVSDESNALAWCDIAALASDDASDASLRRMAQKWLAADRW